MENQVINYTTLSTSTKPKPSKLRIFFVILLSVVLIAVIVFSILVERSSDFTEAEHVARVTALAKKRYLGNDEKYTDLQVYPIYDQDDKLQYFLIELEPVGYMIVGIQRTNIYSGMYTRGSDEESMYWFRYVSEKGAHAWRTNDYGKRTAVLNRRWTELDDNNEPIKHYDSPYKAAGIQNERRYILNIDQGSNYGHIFAVKCNDKYFNVITMQCMSFNYTEDEEFYAADNAGHFPVNRYFDL